MASFYCDYSQTSDVQTPEAILASFSYQLLRRLDSIPVEVDSIYHRHRRENTRPDLNEHVEILEHISTAFSKVWLLIDALDEFDSDCRDDLARVIETLMTFTKVLVTSRPQSIDSENLEGHTLRCTISAQDEDLKVFIESRMTTASRGIRESPGWNVFVSDAQDKLVTLADGMFILVSLQLDMLLRLHTVTEMRRALETIPDKLDDFYKITLDRIRAGKSDKPLKILAWLVTFRQTITVGALREALAVEDSTTFIDPNAMIPEDDIVPMCCGLVLIHVDFLTGFRELSLAHATVHEYLCKNLEMVHGFDRIIAKACVGYVNLLRFSTQVLVGEYVLVGSIADRHPFLFYAFTYLVLNKSYPREPDEVQAFEALMDMIKGSFDGHMPPMLEQWDRSWGATSGFTRKNALSEKQYFWISIAIAEAMESSRQRAATSAGLSADLIDVSTLSVDKATR